MNKFLLLPFICFLFFSHSSDAQTYEWAYNSNQQPRSDVAAIKQDQSTNFYLASFTDSAGVSAHSQFEKRNAAQQLLWQKNISGNVFVTDLEINPQNHAVVIGSFIGVFQIDAFILTGILTTKTGFVLECDTDGTVLWAHSLAPVTDDFTPVDLFIAPTGEMYFSSSLNGASGIGFCAFHKMDSQGNIIKNEFNSNFEDRTFSHIIADSDGNVYLSGTCGNGATFDTLTPTLTAPYQNFLIKYDSSFTAQWILCKAYITFDDNNSLATDGQNYYWVFDDFDSNADTTKILKCSPGGQVLLSVAAPLGSSFFPTVRFSVDSFGKGVLLMNVYNRFYLYRYDNNFNITWNDSINAQMSGFPAFISITCYDSSFYLAAKYYSDTLRVGSFTMLNPHTGTNYPSDIFVAKWGYNSSTSINDITMNKESLEVFPNPFVNELNIVCTPREENQVAILCDVVGKFISSQHLTSGTVKLQSANLASGIYFLKVNAYVKKIIRAEMY